MADIAQILLLPSPVRAAQNPVVPRTRDDLAIGSDPTAGDNARARRFRFRVYEGGNAGATETQSDPRLAGRAARASSSASGTSSENANDVGTGNGAARDSTATARPVSRSNSGTGASSSFLAQSIAQEHLGEGLHNPPVTAAAAAYGRANAALAEPLSAGIDLTA